LAVRRAEAGPRIDFKLHKPDGKKASEKAPQRKNGKQPDRGRKPAAGKSEQRKR